MKTPRSYFLLTLTTLSVATTSMVVGSVYDMNGDIITTESYYVVPFVSGQGGGLTLRGHNDKPCPLDIIQETSQDDEGLPIRFSNWRSGGESVPLDSNLNIETNVAATICMKPTYWWVNMLISIDMQPGVLTTGPKPEGFGVDTVNSFFRIKQISDRLVYKFMFCPGDSGAFCMNVGVFVDGNGVRRLGLNLANPLLFQFKKAYVIGDVVSKNS